MSATARKSAPLPEDIRAMKGQTPIVSLTGYTTPMAQLLDPHCDFVLVGDFEGYLHWLSQEDGRMVARTRVGSDPISATPVVVGEVVYVLGEGGRLQALTLAPPETAL